MCLLPFEKGSERMHNSTSTIRAQCIFGQGAGFANNDRIRFQQTWPRVYAIIFGSHHRHLTRARIVYVSTTKLNWGCVVFVKIDNNRQIASGIMFSIFQHTHPRMCLALTESTYPSAPKWLHPDIRNSVLFWCNVCEVYWQVDRLLHELPRLNLGFDW